MLKAAANQAAQELATSVETEEAKHLVVDEVVPSENFTEKSSSTGLYADEALELPEAVENLEEDELEDDF